jgi:hypothetical protein
MSLSSDEDAVHDLTQVTVRSLSPSSAPCPLSNLLSCRRAADTAHERSGEVAFPLVRSTETTATTSQVTNDTLPLFNHTFKKQTCFSHTP